MVKSLQPNTNYFCHILILILTLIPEKIAFSHVTFAGPCSIENNQTLTRYKNSSTKMQCVIVDERGLPDKADFQPIVNWIHQSIQKEVILL